jgi:hypothetical protein
VVADRELNIVKLRYADTPIFNIVTIDVGVNVKVVGNDLLVVQPRRQRWNQV